MTKEFLISSRRSIIIPTRDSMNWKMTATECSLVREGGSGGTIEEWMKRLSMWSNRRTGSMKQWIVSTKRAETRRITGSWIRLQSRIKWPTTTRKSRGMFAIVRAQKKQAPSSKQASNTIKIFRKSIMINAINIDWNERDSRVLQTSGYAPRYNIRDTGMELQKIAHDNMLRRNYAFGIRMRVMDCGYYLRMGRNVPGRWFQSASTAYISAGSGSASTWLLWLLSTRSPFQVQRGCSEQCSPQGI